VNVLIGKLSHKKTNIKLVVFSESILYNNIVRNV